MIYSPKMERLTRSALGLRSMIVLTAERAGTIHHLELLWLASHAHRIAIYVPALTMLLTAMSGTMATSTKELQVT